MRKFFIILIFLCSVLGASIFGFAIPSIQSSIQKDLKNLGFKNIETKNFKLSKTGVSYDTITANYLSIENLEADIYWPTYFFNRRIDTINVGKIDIKKELIAQSIMNKRAGAFIENLPSFNIQALDLSVTPNMTITTSFKKSDNNLSGTLKTNLPNLNINGNWTATQDKDGQITIDWDAKDLNLSHKLASVKRGQGWGQVLINDNHQISLQLESGGGALLSAPLNNIQFIIGHQGNGHNLIFRSVATGSPDIKLSTDIEWQDSFDFRTGVINLSSASLKSFLDYLKTHDLFTAEINTLSAFKNLNISISYLSERRFESGPYPFEINITSDSTQILNGNFLIYPDSLDIRGSMNGEAEILSLLTDLVPLQYEQLDPKNIRINDNLTSVR